MINYLICGHQYKICLCDGDQAGHKNAHQRQRPVSTLGSLKCSQASASSDGKNSRVTRTHRPKPPSILDARTLDSEFECQISNWLGDSGQGLKSISLLPLGKHLVIALNCQLSQFDTSESSWAWIETYAGFFTPAHDTFATRNMKTMAFTTDRNMLVAADENLAIMKDKLGPYLVNIQDN